MLLADLSVLALTLAMRAALSRPVRVVLERNQRRDVAVDHEPHPAAETAVPAIGPPEGHMRLAAKAD